MKKGGDKLINRMFRVNPAEEEIFLRLLQLYNAGAKSFEDLGTINKRVVETFRKASCIRLRISFLESHADVESRLFLLI